MNPAARYVSGVRRPVWRPLISVDGVAVTAADPLVLAALRREVIR